MMYDREGLCLENSGQACALASCACRATLWAHACGARCPESVFVSHRPLMADCERASQWFDGVVLHAWLAYGPSQQLWRCIHGSPWIDTWHACPAHAEAEVGAPGHTWLKPPACTWHAACPCRRLPQAAGVEDCRSAVDHAWAGSISWHQLHAR